MSEADEIEDRIPRLASSGYDITSCQTARYNCVAWAMNDDTRVWSPSPFGTGSYWPPDLPAWNTVKVFIELFAKEGFVLCDDDVYEDGYEKIAIFVYPDSEPAHVARQLPTGRWVSKLGDHVDIEHNDVRAVECGLCGEVEVIMRRPYQQST